MKPRHVIPAILLAMLVAYPLSVGPVARWYRFHSDGRVPLLQTMPHWARAIYSPLEVARSHSWFLDSAVECYVELCGVETD